MLVIKELLEVYNHYIRLPLIIMNSKNEMEYIEDYNNVYKNISNDYSNFSEIENFIRFLKSPTVITIQNSPLKVQPHYMVTPLFNITGEDYFILAGPFTTEKSVQETSFLIWGEDEIQQAMFKLNKLYQFIVDKDKNNQDDNDVSLYQTVMRQLLSLKINEYEPIQMVNDILTQLTIFNVVDFTGIGVLKENGLYEIEIAKGKLSRSIIGKRFFWDEGVLGDAIQENRPILWHKSAGEQGIQFFLKHNISPNHLLIIPINACCDKHIILFLGNFASESYNKNFITFIEIVIATVTNLYHLKNAEESEYRLTKSITNMNEILNGILQKDKGIDIQALVYEAVSFLVGYENVCFTSVEQEIIYHKDVPNDLIQLHHNRKFYEDEILASFGNDYIFYYLHFIGHFTMKVSNNIESTPTLAYLNILNTIIHTVTSTELLQQTIDLMYSTTKQLQKSKYEQISKLVKAIKRLREYITFDSKSLINLCKLMAFPIPYQHSVLINSKEGLILNKALLIMDEKSLSNVVGIESQIYAQLYTKYILNKVQDLDISKELKHAIDNEVLAEEMLLRKSQIVDDFFSEVNDEILTKREKQVLHLIIKGSNNLEIAEALSISIHTVKNHVTNIFKKLDISDRVELMTKIVNSSII